MRTINLKENHSVESAIALVEIEIENAKKENISAIKVLHGYGSHGHGGVILQNLRRQLGLWKRQKFIKDFFSGDKWNMFEKSALEIIYNDKTIAGDEDFGGSNPGITIIRIF